MEKNYILKDGVLYHHGVPGQKWGVRRYQNEDGTLTAEGREHYGLVGSKERNSVRAAKKKFEKARSAYDKNETTKNKEAFEKARQDYVDKRSSYLKSDVYKYQDKKAEQQFIKDLTKEYRKNMSIGEKIAADILTLDILNGAYSRSMALTEGNISTGYKVSEMLKIGALPFYYGQQVFLEPEVREKL